MAVRGNCNILKNSAKYLFLLLLAFIVVHPASGQQAPPVLTSFTFSPTAVNTTTGSASVTFTAQATDNLAGIASFSADFVNPSGTQNEACELFLISGTDLNGTYQCTITIPEYSEPGTWLVSYVYLSDPVNNYVYYYTSQLQSLGFPTQLIVDYTSTVALASSTNPSSYEQPVTFTATVTSGSGTTPTGNVNFNNGSETMGSGTLNASGVATFTTSNLGLGSQTIVAAYLGDANNPPASSSALIQAVDQAATTTSLTSSHNPSKVGYPVTFTAAIEFAGGVPPDGDVVEFFDGATKLGSAKVSNGTASFTTSSLAAGIHRILAEYRGDVNLVPSTSAPVYQGVKP
jgi:hypothetical protein